MFEEMRSLELWPKYKFCSVSREYSKKSSIIHVYCRYHVLLEIFSGSLFRHPKLGCLVNRTQVLDVALIYLMATYPHGVLVCLPILYISISGGIIRGILFQVTSRASCPMFYRAQDEKKQHKIS